MTTKLLFSTHGKHEEGCGCNNDTLRTRFVAYALRTR